MADTPQSLADKSEIADLIHTYALNIRKGQPELNAALFTADASFEIRQADPLSPETLTTIKRSEGLPAVMAVISGSTTGHRVFPAIHNLIVTLFGGASADRASATSLMIATVFPGGSETLGDYDDSFRREDGGWRFSARIYTIYRES